MLSNFHTHTQFCDGKNTPEEIVLSAIDKGFSAIGFWGHGYTDFDLRYCMKNTDLYIASLTALKEKYKDKIEVYIGVEEDAFCPVNRERFDYIIGSSHYFCVDGKYYPIDSSHDYFKKCLEVFNYDIAKMAEAYYRPFCEYIKSRKPDIIGHFDLITKFDELEESLFLKNAKYNKIAEKYIAEATKSGSVFELNTGAVARELRTAPYPSENLLYILKKLGARIILSSDSHIVDTLDFGFDEAKKHLKHVGFNRLTTIKNGKFEEYNI